MNVLEIPVFEVSISKDIADAAIARIRYSHAGSCMVCKKVFDAGELILRMDRWKHACLGCALQEMKGMVGELEDAMKDRDAYVRKTELLRSV
jgi:hypothetical protein